MISTLRRLFRTPAKPRRITAKDLEPAFVDLNGRQYYRINTQLGIGLEHYGKAMEFTMWMSAGLTARELDRLIVQAEAEMENLVQGKKGTLAKVGWCLQEIRLRRDMVIHTELLYQFIACHYIREDEPLTEWIESIHNEKVEAFKAMVRKAGESYSFFFQFPELKNLTGISTMSSDEWNAYWTESLTRQENLQKQLKAIRSVKESASGVKTSTAR